MKATVISRSFGDIHIEIADAGHIKYECHVCIPHKMYYLDGFQ